jgi:hypothetical protein
MVVVLFKSKIQFAVTSLPVVSFTVMSTKSKLVFSMLDLDSDTVSETVLPPPEFVFLQENNVAASIK